MAQFSRSLASGRTDQVRDPLSCQKGEVSAGKSRGLLRGSQFSSVCLGISCSGEAVVLLETSSSGFGAEALTKPRLGWA